MNPFFYKLKICKGFGRARANSIHLKYLVCYAKDTIQPKETKVSYDKLLISALYGESFRGTDHLDCILKEAQAIVNEALVSC